MDFDPEFAGEDDAVRVQKRIFEQTRWIGATKGLVSRGSRVGLLDAWRQSPQMAAGPDFIGWYFPGNVGVAPDWKGKGLGRWSQAARANHGRGVEAGASARLLG